MRESELPSVREHASEVPSVAELLAHGARTAARQKARFFARKAAKLPNGNGPPNGYRATHARPPPHIAVPRHVGLDDYRKAQIARARGRGFSRGPEETGGLPWWAWVVRDRCERDWRAEVAHLPRPIARRVIAAAETFTTADARMSVATLGVVCVWLSLRHPRYCGQASNVAGVPGALLACLTSRRWRGTEGPYSLSAIQHANHVGAGPGDPEQGTAGFLEALRQFGALQTWVPPARHVPDWMRGEVYAFAMWRVPNVAWEDAGVSAPELGIPEREVPY